MRIDFQITNVQVNIDMAAAVGGVIRKPGLRRLMLESLGIDPQVDYVTFPWLGNTGSVALPITMAIGRPLRRSLTVLVMPASLNFFGSIRKRS